MPLINWISCDKYTNYASDHITFYFLAMFEERTSACVLPAQCFGGTYFLEQG